MKRELNVLVRSIDTPDPYSGLYRVDLVTRCPFDDVSIFRDAADKPLRMSFEFIGRSEKVARALFSNANHGSAFTWDTAPAETRAFYMGQAKAALDANKSP